MLALFKDKDLSSHSDLDSSLGPPPSKKSKAALTLGKLLGEKQSSSSTTLMLETRTRSELDLYLKSPTLNMDSCPLTWWKQEKSRLPMLSSVARKFLCICATSVSSERIFSTGGNIVTDHRTCLKPNKVDQLVFLAKNL